MVQYLRLRIATGGDDLRGGSDNLNITVRFGEHGFQGAPNVNKSAEWANNSVHLVEIKLTHPVPLNELKSITLDHLTGGGLTISPETVLSPIGVLAGLKSADNWDMQRLEVTAVGGGLGTAILQHGFKRFTASDPILNSRLDIPVNTCAVGERFGRLHPGTNQVRLMSGGVSKYGTEPPAPSNVQPAPVNGSRQWQNNRIIKQALAHIVSVGPRAGLSGELVGGSNSTLAGVLRRQSAMASSLLSAANSGGVKPAGTPLAAAPSRTSQNAMLVPKGSAPQIGTSQLMSASGGQTIQLRSTPTALNAQNGPTRHQAPDSPKPQMIGTRAPAPTQVCLGGIATVDGQKSGVWFSPVPGPEGTFVIQGCGFGQAPGQVYLSGVKYASGSAMVSARGNALGSPLFRDRVAFQIPANGWNDRQIVAQIDPNASGFYDTNNVTLVVKTANGQQYIAGGFNFSAAREDQVLKFLPKPSGCTPQSTGPACVPIGVNLAGASTSAGPVRPDVESPSVSLLQAGETIAISREAGVGQFPIPASLGLSFAGRTDTYQFHFAPGFQLDPHTGVQLRHASMDASYCQSVNGVPSKNGSWGLNYTSTASFQVSWQEEACWPKTVMTSGNSLDVMNYASVSAYELQITVLGPRGVSPWAGGNVSSITTQKSANWLQKH